jgi:hypothetical protein
MVKLLHKPAVCIQNSRLLNIIEHADKMICWNVIVRLRHTHAHARTHAHTHTKRNASWNYLSPTERKVWHLTSLTSGGRSVGIVRLRTKATEFSFLVFSLWQIAVIVVRGMPVKREIPMFQAAQSRWHFLKVVVVMEWTSRNQWERFLWLSRNSSLDICLKVVLDTR